jgi:hypothetical protein
VALCRFFWNLSRIGQFLTLSAPFALFAFSFLPCYLFFQKSIFRSSSMEEKKKGRGGKRDGAGRPRGEDLRMFSVCVSAEFDAKLKEKAAAQGLSRLAFCRSALGFAHVDGVPEDLLGICKKKRGPALPEGRGEVFIQLFLPVSAHSALKTKAAELGVSFHCLCRAALVAAVGRD